MKFVRRSRWSYFSYLLVFLICLVNVLKLHFHSAWMYYWLFIGFSSLVIIFRLLVKPYYFEVKDTRLIITRDLFYEEHVELDTIEKIELEEGPFSISYIRLRNNKTLKFNYFVINDKDFDGFKESLQLKVE